MLKDQRLPPQGGLPPAEEVGGAVVEIACDESGFSGTNLLDTVTPLFTHASVDLRVEEADDLLRSLRSGSRWSLNEFKSGRFLRSARSGEALEWLLMKLSGRAHVHLVDKEYFLVTRIVDLFLVEPTYAAGTRLSQANRPAALALYRAGRAGRTGVREWSAFLTAFVNLVRTKRKHQPDRSAMEGFFQARDSLAGAGLGADAEAVLDGLTPARVWEILIRLAHEDRSIPPPLEPMLPALAETVLFWSGGRRRVLVIHDEQSALTAGRLRRLQQMLAYGADPPAADASEGEELSARDSPFAGLVTVDSRDDPRVQVADLLAGIARRTSDVGDDLLQSFLSPTSLRDPER
ncbi:hypothetical protein ABZV93_27705 [Actinopolymorpha sp. NPDC004070]|uniref:hypothetical protein n=1 Tax=Actinopolymorpha sp. NPDC004070 TaxID=3154548 RepID=UPI0033B786DB